MVDIKSAVHIELCNMEKGFSLLIRWISVFIIGLVIGSGASAQCPDPQHPDKAPILAIYNALNGPNWPVSQFAAWHQLANEDICDPCLLEGVVCVNDRVSIIGRNNQPSISGTLPPEIGDLLFLTSFNMGNCSLTGAIPPEIGNLTALQTLALFDNNLTGTIPPEIGNLTDLQNLDLGANGLSGSIPTEIGNLTALTSLGLRSNNLSGSIPSEIGNLTSLQFLFIFGNSLSGALPSELGNLSLLQNLNAGFNNFTDAIPPELGNLTSLQYIFLGSNNLSGTIPSGLGNLSGLTELSLFSNNLGGCLPSDLQNLCGIDVSLNGNPLLGTQQDFNNWCNTGIIDADNDGICANIDCDEGVYPDKATILTFYNSLNGPNWPSASFANWHELANDNICDPCLLEGVTCSNNRVTRLEIQNQDSLIGELPSEIGSLSELTRLYLNDNQISGSIPSSLGDITGLRDLDLSNNQLEGSLPEEFGNLTSISFFSFNDNDLSGCLPSSFQNLCAFLGGKGGIVFNLSNNAQLGYQQDFNNWCSTGPIDVDNDGICVLDDCDDNDPNNGSTIAFSIFADVTVDAGIQTNLIGGTPTGGVYSGTGVTDDGNGTTFTFDPSIAGLGIITITYTNVACSTSTTSDINVVPGGCPDPQHPDKAAILALYDSLNGLNWPVADFQNWHDLKNEVICDPCLLEGVTCTSNRITKLEITDEPALSGALPSAISSLTELSNLNLGNNNITGSIPPSIGNLSALSFLRLNQNSLSGEIPVQFWNALNLFVVDLRMNALVGPIAPEIGQLSNIFSFDVSDNNLSGSIPTSIGNLTTLVGLSANGNNFTGTIPNEITNLNSLTSLNIRNNNLSGELPEGLGLMNNLNAILVNNNDLSGCIPSSMLNKCGLVNINLLNNPSLQYGGDFQSFCDNNGGDPTFSSLTDITLDAGIQSSLSGGSPTGGIYSGTGVTDNGDGISFSFDPDLAGEGQTVITYTVTNANCVKEITQTISVLPAAGCPDPQHPDYNAIVALQNALSGPDFESGGKYASWLQIDEPGFCNPCASDLHGVICTDDRVTFLVIQPTSQISTNINGTIPPEIGELSELNYLAIIESNISGNVPSEIGQLSKLESLNLYKNQLTGQLPASLGNLGQLMEFQAYDNELSGSIPTEFGNMSSLSSLLLFQNTLSGPIPESFGNLSSLEYLRLFDNNLSGPLPVNLGNATSLINLQLSDNQFLDSIPSSYGNLTQLELLDLRSSSLIGELPNSLGNLINAKDIYLYANDIEGEIPESFGNLNSINRLFLYGNNLSGCLPFSLANLCASNVNLTGNSLLGDQQSFSNWCTSGQVDTDNDGEGVFCDCDDNDPNNGSTIALAAFSDIQVDGGIQTNLGGGTPIGGVYSGIGITDDGNGQTFTFDPSIFGEGVMTITYTDVECGTSATADINILPSCIAATPPIIPNSPIVVCQGNPIPFQDIDLPPNTTIKWYNTATGGSSLGGGIVYFPQASGIYYAETFDPVSGCFSSSRSPLEIQLVNDYPTISIVEVNCSSPSLITDVTFVSDGHLINGGIGSTTQINDSTYLFENTFDLSVQLQATSATGCITQLAVDPIESCNCNETIPTFVQDTEVCSPTDFQPVVVSIRSGKSVDWYDAPVGGNRLAFGTSSYTPSGLGSYYAETRDPNTGCKSASRVEVKLLDISEDVYFNDDLPDVYTQDGIVTGLGDPEPVGGVYSGLGVTDDGNGLTFSFDPSLFEAGPTTITYTLQGTCNQSITSTILVIDGSFVCPEPAHPDYNAIVSIYNSLEGPEFDTGGKYESWLQIDEPSFCSPCETFLVGVSCQNNRVVKLNISASNNIAANITGTIPSEIVELTELEDLRIEFTNITGALPFNIGLLSKLEIISIFGNPLISGTLPESIGDLLSLEFLSIDDTGIGGMIPETIGNLSNLINLNLSRNDFSGSIPAGIGSLSNIQEISLRENRLSGELPATLGLLTTLEGLYLIDNEISGEIPGSIGNLLSLTNLNLSSNNLSGCLPQELLNLCSQNVNLTVNPELGTRQDFQTFCTDGFIDLDDDGKEAACDCDDADDQNACETCPEPITFAALDDICASSGIQTGLSGGLPIGGVYSGPGVTDDGNGLTYSFDPTGLSNDQSYTHSYFYDNGSGCSITRSDEFMFLPTIAPPIPVGSDPIVCDGELIPPLAANAGAESTVDWYDAPFGGTLLRTGINAGVNIYLNSTPGIYYAESRELTTGCISDSRTPFTLTINPQPTLSILATECDVENGQYSITLEMFGGDLSVTTGIINDLGNGSFIITAIPITASVNVRTVNSTECEVSEIVDPPICCNAVAPTSLGNEETCGDAPYPLLRVDVSASSGIVNWYDAPTGGNLLTPASTKHAPDAPGIFYAEFLLSTTCISPTRTAVELIDISVDVTFPELGDIDQIDGIQTNLGGGTPTGGVYSGNGVTDNGNGLTFTFDPNITGKGLQTITYTLQGTCMEFITSTVNVVGPPDQCSFITNDELEIELPSGDSEVEVCLTDNSFATSNITNLELNGSNILDNATGCGTGSYTYYPVSPFLSDFNNNSGGAPLIFFWTYMGETSAQYPVSSIDEMVQIMRAIDPASDWQFGYRGGAVIYTRILGQDEITEAGTSSLRLANGSITNRTGVVSTGINVSLPSGAHEIIIGDNKGCLDTVTVIICEEVSFGSLADVSMIDGVQTDLGGGSPVGGVYSGTGVTDNGNGLSFTFDPNITGEGVQTINYTLQGVCMETVTTEINVFYPEPCSFVGSDTIYAMVPEGASEVEVCVTEGFVYSDVITTLQINGEDIDVVRDLESCENGPTILYFGTYDYQSFFDQYAPLNMNWFFGGQEVNIIVNSIEDAASKMSELDPQATWEFGYRDNMINRQYFGTNLQLIGGNTGGYGVLRFESNAMDEEGNIISIGSSSKGTLNLSTGVTAALPSGIHDIVIGDNQGCLDTVTVIITDCNVLVEQLCDTPNNESTCFEKTLEAGITEHLLASISIPEDCTGCMESFDIKFSENLEATYRISLLKDGQLFYSGNRRDLSLESSVTENIKFSENLSITPGSSYTIDIEIIKPDESITQTGTLELLSINSIDSGVDVDNDGAGVNCDCNDEDDTVITVRDCDDCPPNEDSQTTLVSRLFGKVQTNGTKVIKP